MSKPNINLRFLNAWKVGAGVVGIVLALLTPWGRWAVSGGGHFLFYGFITVALAALGFGIGVLVSEICARLFKKSKPRGRKRTTAGTPGGGSYAEARITTGMEEYIPPAHHSNVQRNSSTSFPPWMLIVSVSLIAVAVLGGGAFLFLGWLGDRNDEQAANRNGAGRQITRGEIKQVMERLNGKLPYLSITDAGDTLTLLNSDGTRAEDPTASYLITVQDKYVGKVSIFDAKDYFMPSTPQNLDQDVRELCGTIDKALEEDDDILKALQDAQIKGKLSLSLWKVVEPGIEFSPPKAWLIQVAAFLRAVVGLPAKKVEVLVKGYADGQTAPWKSSLRKRPYDYRVVNVYPRSEPDKIDSVEFIRAETPKDIPDRYSNEHLPELRARFVAENFISKFLNKCKGTTETEVHVLEGYADTSGGIRERDRRVEIYVNIY